MSIEFTTCPQCQGSGEVQLMPFNNTEQTKGLNMSEEKAAGFGEPWNYHEHMETGRETVFNCCGHPVICRTEDDQTDYDMDFGSGKTQLHRVVDCVNALAGIDRPAEFMAEVRGLLRDALENLKDPWVGIGYPDTNAWNA